MGLDKDLSGINFGLRTERYALILEDLVVKYVGVSICLNHYHNAHVSEVRIKVESGPGVSVAGADAVLADIKKRKESLHA